MKRGLKVFDADAHVVYPPDLWSRFLDARFQDRVVLEVPTGSGRSGRVNARVTVDGRYAQHDRMLYTDILGAISWTPADIVERYGELVTLGFTGDRTALALEVEGVDVSVVYGPAAEMWFDGIDPEIQAGLARVYNRWGQEMRESSNGRVATSGPIPIGDVSRAVDEIQYAYDHLGIRCFWALS